jgi:competence protein CoiA
MSDRRLPHDAHDLPLQAVRLMFVARDQTGRAIEARPGIRASCPLCREPVRPRCGQLVSWHFAHHAREDCDVWSEGETAWHRDWKEAVPVERREVVIGRSPGPRHRADIVAVDGTVVELQHSSISPAEIVEREAFYRRMVWVFDVTQPLVKGRLWIKPNYEPEAAYRSFIWKHCRTSLAACRRPIYFDWGGNQLLKVRTLDRKYRFWGGYGFLGDRAAFVAWLNQSCDIAALLGAMAQGIHREEQTA